MKKILSMWRSATIEVKQRTLIFFITWIFSIYALINNLIHNGFNAETIQTLAATIVTGIASMASWWKNNSFSAAAISADQYKDALNNSVFEEVPEDNITTEDEEGE